MIERIQLRGISRSPSDRMSADGGCAESLNVYIDSAESAPAFIPEDVTQKAGLLNVAADQIFLHKTANYENYIIVYNNTIFWHSLKNQSPIEITKLASDEIVNDTKNIGNTVIISTNHRLYYLLYKDGNYKFIGNQIPFPMVSFDVVGSGQNYLFNQTDEYATAIGDEPLYFTEVPEEDEWNSTNEEGHNTPILADKIRTFLERIWSDVSFFYKQYVNPVFFRYSVTLFDGTRLSSIPILLGAGPENPIVVTIESNDQLDADTEGNTVVSSSRFGTFGWTVNFNREIYDVRAQIKDYEDLANWMDIIQSIDIFVSKDLPWNAKKDVSQISNRVYNQNKVTGTNRYTLYTESSCELRFVQDTERFEQDILDVSSKCYLLESIPLRGSVEIDNEHSFSQAFVELISGKILKDREESEDLLVQKELLIDDDMKHYPTSAKRLETFNSRLLLLAPTQILSFDYDRLNSFREYKVDNTDSLDVAERITYEAIFGIDVNGQKKYIQGPVVVTEDVGITREEYNAFQIFPDSRCSQMILKITKEIGDDTEILYGRFPMIPHPYLDCAYLYKGLNNDLAALCDSSRDIMPTIDNFEESLNKIYMSNTDNPFFFDIKGRYTFQSEVLGTAIATTALSQGQFGQFPLYVFTEDGIWAMETAADGLFITQKPLSREVCINQESITPIDNAVVFVTSKGVMILQGSQVMNISPYMNGKHYVLEDKAKEIISKMQFCNLVDILTDTDPFMSFMKDAKVAYDYNGQRLIFISGANPIFQYVYKLDTQTWHKMGNKDIHLVAPLNSYPECLVQGASDETFQVPRIVLRVENTLAEEELQAINVVDMIAQITNYLGVGSVGDPNIINYYNMCDFLMGKIPEVELPDDSETKSCVVSYINRYSPTSKASWEEVREERPQSKLYNLSTILDVADPQPVSKGCIITRPFDLGMPDVLKSIKDIRIRGQYAKGAVQFMLFASMDGIHFHYLNSLRGKSWKLFRIIILTDLSPTERVSWIDVDFEPRFQNRLR